ncbi:MAG: hypothetical protein KC657_28700, partial [Myxococcales bacterium]|nr:hypothetical protein [Myxococcales bacterium]
MLPRPLHDVCAGARIVRPRRRHDGLQPRLGAAPARVAVALRRRIHPLRVRGLRAARHAAPADRDPAAAARRRGRRARHLRELPHQLGVRAVVGGAPAVGAPGQRVAHARVASARVPARRGRGARARRARRAAAHRVRAHAPRAAARADARDRRRPARVAARRGARR